MPKKYCLKCGETYEYEYDNDHYIICFNEQSLILV